MHDCECKSFHQEIQPTPHLYSKHCVMLGRGQNQAPSKMRKIGEIWNSTQKIEQDFSYSEDNKKNWPVCHSTPLPHNSISEKPSRQPNWDCRHLLRGLPSLAARLEQAPIHRFSLTFSPHFCKAYRSNAYYDENSHISFISLLSRRLLIPCKLAHDVFVPHFLVT